MPGLLSATHGNLGVIALVVHPGASGQAVGSDTHRMIRAIARIIFTRMRP